MRWRFESSIPIVGLALALGATMTAGLVSLAMNGINQDEEAAFGVEIGAIKDSLVHRLTAADEVLHGMRLLFEASSSVDVDEFQIIASDALVTNPVIEEVMHLPLIADSERAYFENTKHSEGQPSFRISSVHDGIYLPASRRATYFPITYFEPLTPLATRRLGLDLMGEPEFSPYLQRAIDHGASTSAIPLRSQAVDGYMVFKAIYADRPKLDRDAVAERRKLISGFVAIKVNASKLLESQRRTDPRVSVVVSARPVLDPDKRVELARRDSPAATAADHWGYGALEREREVIVGDQRFNVRFRKDLYWADLKLGSLFFAALAGGLFTLMLWSLAKSIKARAEDLQRRNLDIQQVVEMRTRELAAEKERVLVTLESIADSVITADSDGIIVYLNPVAERLSGWTEQEAIGRPIVDLFKVLDETTMAEVDNPALLCLRSGTPVMRHEKSLLVNRHGTTVAINESAAPIRDAQGRVSGVVLVFHDVSNARRLTQQMSHQATHDALTGLPNRILLLNHLEAAIETAGANGHALAVMFLDLDRFKIVNDTLGHDAGDKLLCEVANRLKACLREGDCVCRLGGDEFVIVSSAVKDGKSIQLMAERVLREFRQPFDLGQGEFFASTSIGISVFPKDGVNSEALVKNADAAMYRVKACGKDDFGFFDQAQDQSQGERLGLEAELRHALERQELVVHYQPQFAASTRQVTGFEALIRWQHPVRGLIPPLEFLPIAEETGLIVDIGDWVMRQACIQNRAWQQMGLPKVVVAVNVAHKQFMRPSLVRDVEQVLLDTGLEAQYLELELTESILADNAVEAAQRLGELKAAGVKLSIDDFGTGYSSLFYLKSFPLDSVKIDRCFVKDLETDPRDAAISAAIIAMSHSLKLTVVAEGVESRGQVDFLRKKGCDRLQGFLFSRAVPAHEAGVFLSAPGAGRTLGVEQATLLDQT